MERRIAAVSGGTLVMGTWECAKNAVQKRMTDKCVFTEMEEQTTAWGETKMMPKEQTETICKMIHMKQDMQKNGLIWENRQKAVLLYPVEMDIPKGSLASVETENGMRYEGKIGESIAFVTHKEADWKQTEVFG